LPSHTNHTEKELLHHIAGGDEKAFVQIFNAYRNKIYTVAYKLTGSQRNAEEIVQDVFMKIWMKRTGLNEVENFDSWLFIITRNTVYSFLKTRASKELYNSLEETDLIGIGENADENLKQKEFKLVLNEALEKLPPQQKQVYLLSKESGLKYGEIANQMNIAPETARKHLQYAMRSIRGYLLSRLDIGVLILILWRHNELF
jgi:RNA polymerase sigma-70 factor (family 1)